MRTVCIIQARITSTRLPDKVLLLLAGREVLAHVLERLAFCHSLDEPRYLVFLQSVFERLQRSGGQPFLTQDALDLLEREPELLQINEGIVRNEGLLKSLAANGNEV